MSSVTKVACGCCGRDTVKTEALRSRPDVELCRDCVEWLAGKLGVTSTPTLPVVELAGVAFYERAGFGVRVYKEDDDDPGEGFAFVDYDGQSVFDLDVVPIDPASNGAGCYLIVDDPDAWHARISAAGFPVTDIGDTPWDLVSVARPLWQSDPDRSQHRLAAARGAPVSALGFGRWLPGKASRDARSGPDPG